MRDATPFPSKKRLCFCTASFGDKYLKFAQLLAQDLQEFAPQSPFLVVTDQPAHFRHFPNVIAVKHRCRGVQSYHERRYAIHYGLEIADSVMCIDSDVRICAPVPQKISFLPGLTARSCGSLSKHMAKRFRKTTSENIKKQAIIAQMADRVGISLDDPTLRFINEFLFVVTQDGGREHHFLDIWGDLAIYADTLGMFKHPTYAMTLAASKAGFKVYRDEMPGLKFFDDRVVLYELQRQGLEPDAVTQRYLQQQAAIEVGDRTLITRIRNRLAKVIARKLTTPASQTRVRLLSAIAPHTLTAYPQLADARVQQTSMLPSQNPVSCEQG